MKRIITILCIVLVCVSAVGKTPRKNRQKKNETREWADLNKAVHDTLVVRRSRAAKLRQMKENMTGATITLTDKTMIDRSLEEIADMSSHRDTIVVKDDKTGEDMILMRAIKDDNGEMVANEVLDAAVVTARFRNVAERNGKVDLEFDVTVPRNLYDSKWQLRFYPTLTMLDNTTDLEAVYITGKEYRKNQLRGYERYQRYVDSIINDPLLFIDMRNLEIFLKRNIPELYAFKNDTTFVSDTQFETVFGVSEKQAIAHYTRLHAIRRNNRRIANKDKMYAKYVKSPIVEEGIRLDTVIQNLNGDYVYSYTQPIRTSRNLRKATIVLNGDIYDEAKRIYTMPESDPLDFYISSLSSFIDPSPRYLLSVIERKATTSASYNIDFEVGKANILPELRDNAKEMSRIRENLASLMTNSVYDLDSITVTAYASPEGTLQSNNLLCRRRAESVSDYFTRYVKALQDSLKADAGFSIDLSGGSEIVKSNYTATDIKFRTAVGGENWKQLTQEVETSELLPDEEKFEYLDLLKIGDEDERENRMKKLADYKLIREVLYPACRTVNFSFFLGRKGMVKDTVHTTVLDSLYMKGVELMREREYEKAIVILRPYQDYNAAVAFTAMDYNASAMAILQDLPKEPKVEYLKAIIYSRYGDDTNAVQCFMNAANADPSYFSRGNLDPEIRAIIKRYKLDEIGQEDDFDFGY